MTSENWYKQVSAHAPLTQGDLVQDCPIIKWKLEPVQYQGLDEREIIKELKNLVVGESADVVVMTQACDLEQAKVDNAILCPHLGL